MGDRSERWRDARRAWDRLADGRHQESGAQALAALGDIGQLRRLLDEEELAAVRAARGCGSSWAEIAVKLGVTRQSAWERWRELDATPAEPEPGSQPEPSAADAGSATPQAATQALDLLGRAARAARRGHRVTVPDVVGLSFEAARRRLFDRGLVAVLAEPDGPQALMADPERAVVTDQTPESGAVSHDGAAVRLWVDPGGGSGVREPRRPRPTPRADRDAADEPTGRAVG